MSLAIRQIATTRPSTIRVAQAAFSKGNRYLTLRDELGAICADKMFSDLFPKVGQPRARIDLK